MDSGVDMWSFDEGGTKAPGVCFDFPGWQMGNRKQADRGESRVESMLADIEELEDLQDEDGLEPVSCEVPELQQKYLQHLPEDLMLRIFCNLDVQDIVRTGQTCHSIHRVMGHDELWRRLSGYSSSASQASEEPAADLRWLSGQDVAGAIIVRSNRSAARQQQMRFLRQRFQEVAEAELNSTAPAHGLELYLTRHLYIADLLDAKLLSLWRSHVSMRAALCDLWLGRQELDLAWLRCIILQLTRLSWSHCYEALVSCFAQISDAIALGLQSRAPDARLWPLVLTKWQEYWLWLEQAVAECEALCGCVSAERTAEWMARGRPDTPSILDSGKLAFRSLVVLRFGLRARLQDELAELSSAAGWSPDRQRQLRKMEALLKELDVADDGTADAIHHTQDNFREAFALDRGFTAGL